MVKMSTRCQIRFTDGYDTAQIYRHFDGYPEGSGGVLADLLKYSEEVSDNRLDDPSYGAANFIYWCKKQHESYGFPSTGYGVENVGKIHGDEDYIYVVEWPNVKIAKVKCNEVNAFDRDEWDFSGHITADMVGGVLEAHRALYEQGRLP